MRWDEGGSIMADPLLGRVTVRHLNSLKGNACVDIETHRFNASRNPLKRVARDVSRVSVATD